MNYLAKIKGSWLSIALVTLLVVAISVIITLFQPFEYRSSFSLLVIEKQQNLDAYAAAKSAERLSTSLGQVIYTTAFYDKVINSGYLPDDFDIAKDEEEKRNQWKRQIETRIMPDVGMIKIDVYNKSSEKATALANALAVVLSENGTDYVGGGNSIVLKVVDYPLTSKNPARPNVALNIAAGLILGFGGSVGYQVYRTMKEDKAGVSYDNENPPINEDEDKQEYEKSDSRNANDYIIEKHIPAKEKIEQMEELPSRFENDEENVKVIGDIKRGRSVWNEPEEEFRNFE